MTHAHSLTSRFLHSSPRVLQAHRQFGKILHENPNQYERTKTNHIYWNNFNNSTKYDIHKLDKRIIIIKLIPYEWLITTEQSTRNNEIMTWDPVVQSTLTILNFLYFVANEIKNWQSTVAVLGYVLHSQVMENQWCTKASLGVSTYLLGYPSICIYVEGRDHVPKTSGSLVQPDLDIGTTVPQAVTVCVLTRVWEAYRGGDGGVKSFVRYCYISVPKGNEVITRGYALVLVSNDTLKRLGRKREGKEGDCVMAASDRIH